MAHPMDKTRYNGAVIGLHWLTFLLIVAAYAAIELREFFPRGSEPRDALKAWHFTLGLTILALVIVRFVIRFNSSTPPIVPPLSANQKMAAKLGHLALYAFMVAMPVGGWLILSGEAKVIPFWFSLEIPPLIGPNKDVAEVVEEVHETLGKIGYALIGLHTLIALGHHYVMRDNTLVRMLPGGGGK